MRRITWTQVFVCEAGAIVLFSNLFSWWGWNIYIGATVGAGLYTLFMTYLVARGGLKVGKK